MLIADTQASEAEMQRVVQLRGEVAALKEERTTLMRKVEDAKAHEKELLREKDSAFSRITELQSALAVKDVELEKRSKKIESLETRLERSRVVLDSKDQLIESLKKHSSSSGAGIGVGDADGDAQESGSVNASLSTSRQMETSLKVQISDLRDANEDLKIELAAAEERFASIRQSLTEKWEVASKEANSEMSHRKALESEVRGLRQELRVEKDLSRSLKAEVEAVRGELERANLTAKRRLELNASQSESEERLKKLTEALLQKQMALDKANSDRTSLELQVESLKRNERERVYEQQQQVLREVTDDGAHEMVPLKLPRNFYGAAYTLDRVFVALVSRFRRIPNLRLFVIFYIALMQMVFVIFLIHYRTAKHGL